jgi:hypothetical protein
MYNICIDILTKIILQVGNSKQCSETCRPGRFGRSCRDGNQCLHIDVDENNYKFSVSVWNINNDSLQDIICGRRHPTILQRSYPSFVARTSIAIWRHSCQYWDVGCSRYKYILIHTYIYTYTHTYT